MNDPRNEKWWQNFDFVFSLLLGVCICTIAVSVCACIAAIHVVPKLYPNGINP